MNDTLKKISISRENLVDRFQRYVRIDTQSQDPSDTYPSTLKQLDLSRLLVEELKALGIDNAHLTEHGYVFASLPSNLP
ncbi:MAG: hypothetical protein KDI38_26985, partial [Calditrichaeota bacterium]|nr:hypothetical protein [Calditrichota bacterium]MCB0307438.1 hypothetical protein [Calditrichota bacterium]MCB0316452.1 hypothetical protein [Calditrichota bacterium]